MTIIIKIIYALLMTGLLIFGIANAAQAKDTQLKGNDVIISFGTGNGIWRLMNNESWQKLHLLTPEKLMVGDFDGNDIDDVIISFGSGNGIWRWMNNTNWQKLHPAGATQMVVADLDNNGKDDVIVSFGQGGIWRWMNNINWLQLHTAAAAQLAVGDLDNNGKDDVIVSFGQGGIWRWMNNSNWLRLHPLSSQKMVTGDFDGNDVDDIVISFGSAGLWRWMNNTHWQLLHPANSENMVVADMDGNDMDDITVSFGSSGLWSWMNNVAWQRLHSTGANQMAVGDLDNNGQDDVVISFTFGTWRWMNNTNWQQLHNLKGERLAIGNFDKQSATPDPSDPVKESGTNTTETGNDNNSQNDHETVVGDKGNESTVNVQTKVPGVIGLSQKEAEKAIVDTGLRIGKVTVEAHKTIPKGHVIKLEPQENTQLASGSVVNMVISTGYSFITRVSVTSEGVQANGKSHTPRISANGRFVVFESAATNLLPGDVRVVGSDIFVNDRDTGETTLISIKRDGTRGTFSGYSSVPDISADGRYVTFKSTLQLTPIKSFNTPDIYLHDRVLNEISMVSISWDGTEDALGFSDAPRISANGQYVTFVSSARNLIKGGTSGGIFVRDLKTGTTKLVSVASDGAPGNRNSEAPSISADGRYIVFSSFATNLVPGERLNKSFQKEVFLHDQATGKTTLISVSSKGIRSNGDASNPAISADGHYIVFESKNSTNIVPGIKRSNNSPDIYVHDRVTKQTTLVSVHIGERRVSDESYNPQISADGRYITFVSRADDLIHGKDFYRSGYNIFVRDQVKGEITLVSVNNTGVPGIKGQSYNPDISADGNYIAFDSGLSDLVTDDTNQRSDVFVRYLGQ